MAVLTAALGSHIILINGSAVFCYTKDFDLPERLPTDIDVGTRLSLMEVSRHLASHQIPHRLDSDTIRLWGMEYVEPRIVATIGESKIFILNKSVIRKDGLKCTVDFCDSDVFRTRISRTTGIELCDLEYLLVTKEFQRRPPPKSDYRDMRIIDALRKKQPSLFDETRYYQMRYQTIVGALFARGSA